MHKKVKQQERFLCTSTPISNISGLVNYYNSTNVVPYHQRRGNLIQVYDVTLHVVRMRRRLQKGGGIKPSPSLCPLLLLLRLLSLLLPTPSSPLSFCSTVIPWRHSPHRPQVAPLGSRRRPSIRTCTLRLDAFPLGPWQLPVASLISLRSQEPGRADPRRAGWTAEVLAR